MSRQQRNNPKYNRPRRHSNLPLRESLLIFCEGDTEVGYFTCFRKKAKYMPGGNALKIVENAIAFKAANKAYDQYWAVFDKDDTTDQHFEQAIQLAMANGIRVAWSNQAFECRIILHYRDFRHECHRNDYETLIKQFIPAYDASQKGLEQGKQLYRVTKTFLSAAIERAKNGHASFHPDMPAAQKQTCTLIYELVESIVLSGGHAT